MSAAIETGFGEGRGRGFNRSDWRLWTSLALTGVWLLLGFIYISDVVGWRDFVNQAAPELGGFLEGAFAPLAFLWLVVGFFLQQTQLAQNSHALHLQLHEMRRAAEQAEIQARAIAANELHARQDTFIDIAALVQEQLGGIAGYIVMSAEGGEDIDELLGMWARHGEGDITTFGRRIIARFYQEPERARDMCWGTEVRSRHSRDYLRTFERLMAQAEACDPDGLIADALRDGSHGRVAHIIAELRPA